MAGERGGLPGEIGENSLGHVLRQVCIAADLAQGRGVDQIEMPPHQFGEGVLRVCGGVAAEEGGVVQHRV